MKLSDKPLAITDFETSGLDPTIHEIIDIGMVLVDQKSLAILDKMEMKVRMDHPEWADPAALKLNGYKEVEWLAYGRMLPEAMSVYSQKTKHAIFLSYNITFDWAFLQKAFDKTGVVSQLHYYPLDILSMSWLKLHIAGLERYKMDEVARHLGVPPEPMPHQAFNGAMTAYEIFKRLAS